MRGWRYVLIVLGAFVWAMAVFLMVEGGVLGGEDYWRSSPVGCGVNVHDTRHIHECMRRLESKSHNPLTNLLFFFFYSFLSKVCLVNF